MWYHPHDPNNPNEETQECDDDFDPPDDNEEDPTYMPLTDLEERYNAY